MGGRAPEESPAETFEPSPAPPAWRVVALVVFVWLVLMSNGRPIGAGDTRPTERVAVSLVQSADFNLDEFPEVTPPFARDVGAHRVSIYPVLSAVLAVPVFALARTFMALDEAGSALAGKMAASLFSALAAGVMFVAMARRRPLNEACACAILFALGTTVWSTSQALWQHPAAVLFLSLALLFLDWAEQDPRWAARAALPLALAAAARHADLLLVLVVAAAIVQRWPRRAHWMIPWAVLPALFVIIYQWCYFGSPLRTGFSVDTARFSAPWGTGHLGLLFSPAKGLIVFTPLVLVGLLGWVRAYRRGRRWWVATLAAASVAHWVLMGRWLEWHGGESWGPRLMTDALPLLLFFLPEGFDRVPRLLGVALAAVSVSVQCLGAFAYEYRWDRLYGRTEGTAVLWDVRHSPIAYYALRRVFILAVPVVRDGRISIREHPVVPFAPEGNRVTFEKEEGIVRGTPASFRDVHLQRGARAQGGAAVLSGHWDGVFLRVLPEARPRWLELRVEGQGRGTLYVGETNFWRASPRWMAYPMHGAFTVHHAYHYAESGGEDLLVTIGRAAGEARLSSIELVPSSVPNLKPQ